MRKKITERLRKINSQLVCDVEELLEIKLPTSDSDTIAGFVLEYLGRIPQSGEQPKILLDDVSITVVKTEDHRISKLLIEKLR